MFNANIVVVAFDAYAYSGPPYWYYPFPLYFDLTNGKVFSTGKNLEFLEVGRFQCAQKGEFCSSFNFESTLKDIDTITGRLALPADVKQTPFSLTYQVLPEKFESFEFVHDIPAKIETAIAVKISMSSNGKSQTLHSILFQKHSDRESFFSFKTKKNEFDFRFEYPHPGDPWVLGKVQFNQEGPELKISFIFVNSTDFSTTEKKYLIKNVQD